MQCVRVLGQKYDIYLVAPFGLDLESYKSLCPNYKFKEKRFASGFFEDIHGYNQLCKRWNSMMLSGNTSTCLFISPIVGCLQIIWSISSA